MKRQGFFFSTRRSNKICSPNASIFVFRAAQVGFIIHLKQLGILHLMFDKGLYLEHLDAVNLLPQ